MINQNWWFPTLLTRQFKYCPPLNRSIKCDVLIVGGGMSGVSAAVEFLQKGFSVVLMHFGVAARRRNVATHVSSCAKQRVPILHLAVWSGMPISPRCHYRGNLYRLIGWQQGGTNHLVEVAHLGAF